MEAEEDWRCGDRRLGSVSRDPPVNNTQAESIRPPCDIMSIVSTQTWPSEIGSLVEPPAPLATLSTRAGCDATVFRVAVVATTSPIYSTIIGTGPRAVCYGNGYPTLHSTQGRVGEYFSASASIFPFLCRPRSASPEVDNAALKILVTEVGGFCRRVRGARGVCVSVCVFV